MDGHDPNDDMIIQRQRMVEDQIRRRGVTDPEILDVMMAIPREAFVPPDARKQAYEDRALAVGADQTISQPFIVAHMTDLLQPLRGCTILEIGTGTGYQTAILARLAKLVYSVERIASLHDAAAARLGEMRVSNVRLFLGDGSAGLPDHAPFDRILVTAAAPKIPEALKGQLADGGILVVPVGGRKEQTLVRLSRKGDRFVKTATLGCRFVKLIGQEAWPPNLETPHDPR